MSRGKRPVPELNMAWVPFGLCRGLDPAMFYSDNEIVIARAKLICMSCPVRVPCDEYATLTHQYGVWGGRDEVDRRPQTQQPSSVPEHGKKSRSESAVSVRGRGLRGRS